MQIIIGLSKRERAQYYSNVVSFVDKLINIGEALIQIPESKRSTRCLILTSIQNVTTCTYRCMLMSLAVPLRGRTGTRVNISE